MYLPTTNNGRTLWFSEHNSSIRENRFSGERRVVEARAKERKNGNLNNIITPSGEVACWPRAYYYKVLLSAPPPTPRKKTRCLVWVYVCIIHESCAVRCLNRKFKTKKCKKIFYYTTRVQTVLLQSNFEFRKTVKSCLIVFNEPLTQTTLNKKYCIIIYKKPMQ